MNSTLQLKRSAFIIPALLLVLLFSGAAQCLASWDYGNGRHGSFTLTTNATIEQLYQTVRLTNDPPQYNPADTNAIPNFQILLITNGAMLSANSWNGTIGGMIVFKVQGMLSIAAGSTVSVSGEGYRGGGQAVQGSYVEGVQGESYEGSPTVSGNANYGGGGGGYVVEVTDGNPHYLLAAAGGYGEAGGLYYSSFSLSSG